MSMQTQAVNTHLYTHKLGQGVWIVQQQNSQNAVPPCKGNYDQSYNNILAYVLCAPCCLWLSYWLFKDINEQVKKVISLSTICFFFLNQLTLPVL